VITTANLRKAVRGARSTIKKMEEDGVLQPVAIGGNGKGGRHVYDELDLLAGGLAVELRDRGFPRPTVLAIVRWLRESSLEALRLDWAEGRSLIFAVGENEPCPVLLSHAAVFQNDEVDLAEAFRLGVPVAVVDLASLYRQMQSRIASGGEQ